MKENYNAIFLISSSHFNDILWIFKVEKNCLGLNNNICERALGVWVLMRSRCCDGAQAREQARANRRRKGFEEYEAVRTSKRFVILRKEFHNCMNFELVDVKGGSLIPLGWIVAAEEGTFVYHNRSSRGCWCVHLSHSFATGSQFPALISSVIHRRFWFL